MQRDGVLNEAIAEVGRTGEGRRRPRLCVATITHRRPVMLGALLASFTNVRSPAGMELCFLVVDNDRRRSAKASVAAFAASVAGEARYVMEPQSGIPFARNRALNEAHAMGADFLAFVDDDEIVDADWLVEMIGALRSYA